MTIKNRLKDILKNPNFRRKKKFQVERITGMSTENSALAFPTLCDDFRLKVKKTPTCDDFRLKLKKTPSSSQSDPTSLSLHIPGVRD